MQFIVHRNTYMGFISRSIRVVYMNLYQIHDQVYQIQEIETKMEQLRSSLPKLYRQNIASSAVEFALITPCFLMLIFGLSIYASIYVTLNGIQQLAAEAARASVAGLNDTERNQLAQAYISNNTGAYPFLNPQKLTVAAGTTGTAAPTYQVSLTYDMSGSFIYSFTRMFPLPPPQIVRSAAIQRGGY